MASQQKRGTNFTLKPGKIDAPPQADDIPRYKYRKDVITESGEIKKLIRKVISDNGLRLYSVCEAGGFNYDRIKQWLNSRKPENGKRKIGQEEVIDLCKSLGIGVRVTLIVSSVAFPEELKYVKRRANVARNNSLYDRFIEKEDGKPNGQEEEA